MDLRILLLNVHFVMIHIIHKILILIKNHINYLKDNTFKPAYKMTTLGTTQKWSSWGDGRLIKHLHKTATSKLWLFLARF